MKSRFDKDLNLIVCELLTNSGSLLNLTIEEISRKAQVRREEVENLLKKMQKRGLIFISQGRFCLTPQGLLFLLKILDGGENGEEQKE